MRILLIEDVVPMAALIADQLARAGFVVDTAASLADARSAATTTRYGLFIVDRRLPDGDGLSLLRDLRHRQPKAPLLMLTAVSEVAEKVRGLEAGADDYLAKPFEPAELLARVRVLLRRVTDEPAPAIRVGRLSFEPASLTAAVAGRPLNLPRRELLVLESLVRRVGRAVVRDRLLEEVYGFDDEVEASTLETHVSRLRRKLAEADAGVVIHTIRGVGYLLAAEQNDGQATGDMQKSGHSDE